MAGLNRLSACFALLREHAELHRTGFCLHASPTSPALVNIGQRTTVTMAEFSALGGASTIGCLPPAATGELVPALPAPTPACSSSLTGMGAGVPCCTVSMHALR